MENRIENQTEKLPIIFFTYSPCNLMFVEMQQHGLSWPTSLTNFKMFMFHSVTI